jgi:hypothetical protein
VEITAEPHRPQMAIKREAKKDVICIPDNEGKHERHS